MRAMGRPYRRSSEPVYRRDVILASRQRRTCTFPWRQLRGSGHARARKRPSHQARILVNGAASEGRYEYFSHAVLATAGMRS